MKATSLLSIVAMTLVCAAPVQAQEDQSGNDNRCWFGSQSFTKAAVITLGNGDLVCSETGEWLPAKGGANANCLYEGKFYGIGALVGVTNGKGILLQCKADGSWTKAD